MDNPPARWDGLRASITSLRRGFERRGSSIAIGIIIGSTGALIALIIIFGLNYCPGEPCRGDHPLPFYAGPNAADSITDDDVSGAKDYYTRQDLRAQEYVARLTNSIAWATWTGVSVSAIGMLLTFASIWLLLSNLKQQGVAIRQQAEANDIAQSVGEAQSRAYLSIRSIKVFGNANTAPALRVEVENIGETPASELYLLVIFEAVAYNNNDLELREFVLFPGEDIPRGDKIIFERAIHLDTERLNYFNRHSVGIIHVNVQIEVLARDVFDKRIQAWRGVYGKTNANDLGSYQLEPCGVIKEFFEPLRERFRP